MASGCIFLAPFWPQSTARSPAASNLLIHQGFGLHSFLLSWFFVAASLSASESLDIYNQHQRYQRSTCRRRIRNFPRGPARHCKIIWLMDSSGTEFLWGTAAGVHTCLWYMVESLSLQSSYLNIPSKTMCHGCFYYSISMPCWRYLGPFWHVWVNPSKQKRRQPSNRRKHQKTTIWHVLSNLSIHLLAIGFRKLPSSFSKSFSLCATRRRSKAGHAPGDTSSNIAMMVSRDGWPLRHADRKWMERMFPAGSLC